LWPTGKLKKGELLEVYSIGRRLRVNWQWWIDGRVDPKAMIQALKIFEETGSVPESIYRRTGKSGGM
jgi:hypothetical protein